MYDLVDAVRLVLRDRKRQLDDSWTTEQFTIPEHTFRIHQMALLRRIRKGGAVTLYHVYRFELTRQRKLDPYYVPPDPRCQRCKDPDSLPKLLHLIWECAALFAQRQASLGYSSSKRPSDDHARMGPSCRRLRAPDEGPDFHPRLCVAERTWAIVIMIDVIITRRQGRRRPA
ncbi:uncharacterized protein ISCGN_015153 [Ixodes scapularis]